MLSAANYCHKTLHLSCCDPDRPVITVFGKVIIHLEQATDIWFNLIVIYEGRCLYGDCKVILY